MNKITLWIRVCVDHWTAERAVIVNIMIQLIYKFIQHKSIKF